MQYYFKFLRKKSFFASFSSYSIFQITYSKQKKAFFKLTVVM